MTKKSPEYFTQYEDMKNRAHTKIDLNGANREIEIWKMMLLKYGEERLNQEMLTLTRQNNDQQKIKNILRSNIIIEIHKKKELDESLKML